MITKSEIRDMAGNAVYSRGIQIYNMGRIEQFVVDDEGDYDYIEAKVRGSSNNRYQVEFMYDRDRGELAESKCECPAFRSYPGICKHCAAVLLQYKDYQGRKHTTIQTVQKRRKEQQQLSSLKGAYRGRIDPETTPSVSRILQRRQIRRALPVMQNQLYGQVRLEPHLMYITAGILLEFKIGVSQMYVLKDMFAFAQHMQKKDCFAYGKKLEFTHVPEMFDEQSRALAGFICDWTRENMNQYTHYQGYMLPKLKELFLSGRDLEMFLDIMGEQPISANVMGQKEQTWYVTREPLGRHMSIVGKAKGIDVSTDAIQSITGWEDYIYFSAGRIHRIAQKKLDPVADFLAAVAELPQQTAFIRKEDIPFFCQDLLPELEQFFECSKKDFNPDDYRISPVQFKIYLDSPQELFITCKVTAVYDEEAYNIFDDQTGIISRDWEQEAMVSKIVSSYCNAYNEEKKLMVIAEDEERLYEFLVSGIERLQHLGEVFVSDALKRMTVMTAPKVSVGISLSGELLELSLTAGDMPQDQLLEILSRYDRKKKYYRLKSGAFVDMQEEGMQALIEMKQGLGISDSQLKKDKIVLPRYRALYLDSELKGQQALPVTGDQSYYSLIRNMKTVEDNEFELPHSMEAVLREYQKRGFLWLKTLRHNGFGGILADDMGLGKTLQVIAMLMAEQSEPGREQMSLVVSPASLVFNWMSEIRRFAPELSVKMVVGKASERREIIQNAGGRDVLLTSYDLLKRDIESYQEITFANQIIDEAQYIKNHGTQAARAVKQITAGFKLALTGTPVENRLSELWSIFDYVMPGFLYPYKRFREEIEIPVVQNQDENAMKRLQKMIRPFVLRRLKRDVLTDLPDKLERNYFAELEGEQQKLYDAHVKRLKLMLDKQSDEEFKQGKIQILSELTRLRQICCDPGLVFEDYRSESVKARMCMDLIHNAVASGHKILLFSQFTSMLERLQNLMTAEQVSFYTLTGATAKEKRADMVEAFNQDDTQVFCISLKAGGTGLNLTSADIVIHYDPWWNQAVQNQATDRAHRIGQKNIVTVYKLIVKGTIEENIMKLQDKKRMLADQILGGGDMATGSFTREELLELLQ